MKKAIIFDENMQQLDVTHVMQVSELRIANRVYDKPRLFAKVFEIVNGEYSEEYRMYRVNNGKLSKRK